MADKGIVGYAKDFTRMPQQKNGKRHRFPPKRKNTDSQKPYQRELHPLVFFTCAIFFTINFLAQIGSVCQIHRRSINICWCVPGTTHFWELGYDSHLTQSKTHSADSGLQGPTQSAFPLLSPRYYRLLLSPLAHSTPPRSPGFLAVPLAYPAPVHLGISSDCSPYPSRLWQPPIYSLSL